MHHSDRSAHAALAPRATSRAWMSPTPARRRAGLLAALLALLGLVACGGGADTGTPEDVRCNPDTLDCAGMYGAQYPHRFTPDTAEGSDIYSFDPAPRAGYTLIK